MSDDVIGRGVVELEVRDSGVEAGIAKVGQALAGLGPSATKAGAEASAGVAKIGDGAATAADKVDAATTRAAKSIHNLGEAGRKAADGAGGLPKLGAGASEADKKIDAATRNMIASIQRTTAAMEAGSRTGSEYFRVLASQRGVDPAALKPYLAQLDAATAKQTRAGISAGEMSNAMRTLPAQFTDIATSLAGGQDPLLVFIQQGGQLKDMFGGVGPAAQAMGQYIAGLVNPLTVSVAAVAALTYAYHVGSQEAQAYANALIATNNAAGTTSDQMADMAASIDAYYGTQRAAAEAIAAVAETGKVSGENMERFAAVSLQWADATGQSVGDVVEHFAALGKDPVEASLKLDESLRFLTASVLDQITALVEQGRETEAVSVAQNALADVLAKRTPEMQQNIGLIETSWKGVKNVVSEVLDAMASIGRQQTSAQRLAEIKTSLKSGLSTTTSGRDERQRPLSDAELRALRIEQDGLESDMRRAATDAARDAERETRRSKGVKAQQEYNRLLESGATRAEKLAKALQGVDRIAADLSAAGKPLSTAELAKLKAIEAEKYKEPKRRTRTGTGLSSSDNAMASLAGDLAARKRELEMLTAENTVTAKLTATQEKILVVEQKLGLAKKESTKASLRQQLATLQETDRTEQQIAAINEAKKAAEEERKLDEKRTEAIFAANVAREEQILQLQQQAAEYGLTTAQIADNTARTWELSLAEAEKNGASAESIDYLRQQADAYRRLADAQAGLQDKKDVEAREKLAADEAKKAADEWQKSADQINQSLTDALMKGFEDGKGFAENFADSLKATFKTMVLRPVIQAVMQPVGEAVNGMIYGQPGAAGGQQSMFSGSGFGANSAAGMGQLINGYGNLTGSAGTAAYGAGMGLTPEQAQAAAQAYADAGMTDIASSITAGQSAASAAASAATYAGYAMAAYNGVKAVEEGRWGTAAGTAIGAYFGGPIGAAIGAQVGGMVDDAFAGGGGEKGGGNYNAVYDISGKAVAENLFGGYTPDNADGEVKKAVTGFYKTYADTVRKLGGEVQDLTVNLGFDTDPAGSAGNRLSAQLAIGQIGIGAGANQAERELWQASLVSMVSESVGEIPQAIQEATGKMLLAALQASELPEEYARIFDGVDIEAASADQVAAMTAALESTKLLSDVFSQFGTVFPQLAGVAYDAREAIVAAAGGLDVFASGLSAYRDNFYSEAERSAADMEQLQAQFAKLNLTMPATRDGFRQLVEAQDLATLSGQAAYASLIGLAGAFAKVTAEGAAASAEWQLSDERRARSSKQREAEKQRAEAMSELMETLTDGAKAARDFNRSMQEFLGTLRTDDTLSALSPEDKLVSAQADYVTARDGAARGDVSAQAAMQAKASDYLTQAHDYYGSGGAYASIFDSVQSELSKVGRGVAEQAAERLLIAQGEFPSLGVGMDAGDIQRRMQAYWDKVAGLVDADQVDPAKQAFADATSNGVLQLMGMYGGSVSTRMNSDGTLADDGMGEVGQLYLDPYLRAALNRLVGVPRFARGGLAEGLALVGEEGPELVNFSQPGRVYPAEQTRSLFEPGRYGLHFAPLIAEVKALREEVASLRAERREGDQMAARQRGAIAQSTLRQGNALVKQQARAAADQL